MMLAIADFADDEGNAYPAVSTLALKCRMSERNANHILAALKAAGELEIRHNEGPRGTNRYRIALVDADGTGVKRASPLTDTKPLTPASPPTPETAVTPEAGFTLKPVAGGGEAGSRNTLKPASPEPSMNHQEPSGGTRSRRKHPIQPTFAISDAVRAWASEHGFDRLNEHFEAFKLKATANGYRYVDWDAAFKNAIRADWARLRGGSERVRGSGVLHADDNLAEVHS